MNKEDFHEITSRYLISKKHALSTSVEGDVQIVEAKTDYEQTLAARRNLEYQLRKIV